MNIVFSSRGLIEVQGTAERNPFSSDQLAEMVSRASNAADYIFSLQQDALK
jgi:ribonuclease PH